MRHDRQLPGTMTAVVIAFDGVFANTLGFRAHALGTSAKREGIELRDAEIRSAIPSHTFYECCRLLAPAADETTCDIIALRAQQQYALRVSQGVDLVATAMSTLLSAQQSGARIVLRADSNRREVEIVLRQWDMEFAFNIVRCADDLPRTPNVSSVESSYHAISARLDALRVSGERRALENAPHAVRVAQTILGVAELK